QFFRAWKYRSIIFCQTWLRGTAWPPTTSTSFARNGSEQASFPHPSGKAPKQRPNSTKARLCFGGPNAAMFDLFDFDLPGAVTEQLEKRLQAMPASPLTEQALQDLGRFQAQHKLRQGV